MRVQPCHCGCPTRGRRQEVHILSAFLFSDLWMAWVKSTQDPDGKANLRDSISALTALRGRNAQSGFIQELVIYHLPITVQLLLRKGQSEDISN